MTASLPDRDACASGRVAPAPGRRHSVDSHIVSQTIVGSDKNLAPPDGLGGSETKTIDTLAWFAIA